LLEIPWALGPELTDREKAAVASSLQEFQVGESSEGRHLLRDAEAYGEQSGDDAYPRTMRLFIAEEQRHARDLGRFLRLNGIPLVKTTFADRVFRKLRNFFPGLELSISVLVTAEIIAKVYYAAVQQATGSRILRRLCEQILRDEEAHVAFQGEQIARLRARRGVAAMRLTMFLQRTLFLGAVLFVWSAHRPVMVRSKMGFRDWWDDCWREFAAALAVRTHLVEIRDREISPSPLPQTELL
jgi:hypothetical protein